MDYVQALFSFFIAPLFGTVLLGMLWKRATPAGGFWGLLAGTVSSIAHVGLGEGRSRRAALHRAVAATPRTWRRTCIARLWSWIVCVLVTVVVSLMTQAEAGCGTEGTGLRLHGDAVGRRSAACTSGPIFWAVVVARGLRDSEHYLLVRTSNASSWNDFDLVFHRRAAAGLRRPDPRRGHL